MNLAAGLAVNSRADGEGRAGSVKSRVEACCVEILSFLVSRGFVCQCNYEALCAAITLVRGGDPRTVANWIRVLKRLRFIEEVKPRVFKLNLNECSEALKRREEEKNVEQKSLI